MIIQEAKKIVEKHFSSRSVQWIDERNGILRCTKEFEQHPYQVIYIDCSNIWSEKNFDSKKLEDYQSKTLLKDYYGHAGPLQWNYYYAFVSKPEDIKGKDEEKKNIESDELYTRKLVLTPAELDEWLTRVEDLSKPSENLIEKDLGAVWIKKLENFKLDAIFLDNPVATSVKAYMDGKPILQSKEKNKTKGNKSGDDQDLPFIEYLKLEKYRPHPERHEYNFGTVNLIKGANGAGKTSLLESIELLLCGKTVRNSEELTSGYKIQARVRGKKNLWQFEPGNLALFKSRDKYWYRNAEQKFNRLHQGFNKYNFYNTDAAYLLANNPDKEFVRKAFEDIALGQQVNHIESRLTSFREYFYKEYRMHHKVFLDANKDRVKEEKLLKEISKNNDDPERFLAELQKELQKVAWDIKKHREPDKFISILEKDLVIAQEYISTIRILSKWSGAVSKFEIVELLGRYLEAQRDLKDIEKQQKVHEKNSKGITEKTSIEKEIAGLLKRLSPYFKETRLKELSGLTQRIEERQIQLEKLQRADRLFKSLSADLFNEIPATEKFSDFEKSLGKRIKEDGNELRKLTEQQNKLSSGLDQLAKVVTEIKAKGREYLQLNTNATECPLCHTPYSYKELSSLISRSQKNISRSEALTGMIDQVRTKKATLAVLEARQKQVEKLSQIILLLFNTASLHKNIGSLQKELEKTFSGLPSLTQELKSMEDLSLYFEKKGLGEEEFDELLEEGKSINLSIKNGGEFTERERKNRTALQDLQKKSEEIKQLLKGLKDKRSELFAGLDNTKLNEEQIQEKIQELQDTITHIDLLQELVAFKDKDKISLQETAIKNIKALALKYKDIQKQKKANELRVAAADRQVKDLLKRESQSKTLRDRAQKAYEYIDAMVKEDNKTSYLKKFLDHNKDEIVEIFRMIHSPKEFRDLRFDDTKIISLVRKTGKDAALNEISTGQRSALSLSIFSTLNRKLTNGPFIMLFDDPVNNVDDLNILSYLDYIREVAIHGNRQIFFATANENLAFLFSQKFKFLNDDFVTIELERKND